jgi:hypothetical protein
MSQWGVDNLIHFNQQIRRKNRQVGLMRAYGMEDGTTDDHREVNKNKFDTITTDWVYLDAPDSVVSFLNYI